MSKPLKVGLVGTGGISKAHLPVYLEHPDRVQLTACCDIVEPLAQAFAVNAGIKDVYTDLDDMLRNADIDAVDICTGHAQHAEQSIAAAEAGKHVLVEKIMGNTGDECRNMIAAADKSGVTLMVAQMVRFSPETAAVKRFIEAGGLGEIQACRTHVIMQGPNKSWMNDAAAGGGVLMLNTVHHVDLLRYYIGNVKRIFGIRRTVQPQMENGAEDLCAATMEFENGVIGDVFASWTTYLTPEHASYMMLGSKGTIHSTHPENREQAGSHFGPIKFAVKSAERDAARAARRSSNRPFEETIKETLNPEFDTFDTSDTGLPSRNAFINQTLHFEECIRTGAEPISSGRDNIETVKIILGILESSRTGIPVDLADL